MDDLLAWSDQLCVELDTKAAHQYLRVDHLVLANQELSVRFDLLQAKFDHFIDKHWRPMQHFACGVVSCLTVFAGDVSFELPFDVGVGSQSGAPFPPPPSRCKHPSPDAPLSSQFFSDTGVGINSCHDFRRFPPFLCLSPKRPHSFTQPMTCFSFPFLHNLYHILSYLFTLPFYLIFYLLLVILVRRQTRSSRIT